MPVYLNKFLEPDYYDHDIVKTGERFKKVGVLRVKPVSILWKPPGARKFHVASLEEFQEWMKTKKQVDR